MSTVIVADTNACEFESRGLSIAENHLMRWLLTRGAEISGVDVTRAADFLPQLDFLRVVGRCPCGCPTLYFDCQELPLFVDAVTAVLADVEGRSPEGIAMGMILRAVEGRISELEAYGYGEYATFSLPTAEWLAQFY